MTTAKTNKSRPKSMTEQTRKLLSNFCSEDHVLITIVADPDALASALAMKRLLWRRVAGVTIARVNDMSRPDNLAMVRLLNIPLEVFGKLDLARYNKFVLVDGQPHHHEKLAPLKYQVVIDHHPMGELTAKAQFHDIRPKYGATSSIMTEYLRGAKITPSARLATALIYGIRTDTANFGRPVLEADVAAFRFLFPKVQQSVLRKIEFSEMRLGDLSLLRQALADYQVRGHCIFAHLGKIKSPDNLVQIADFFLKVEIVDSSAISGVFDDRLVVIIRNSSPRGNAGKLAQTAFGEYGSAGGHKAHARAEIPLKNLMEILPVMSDKALADFVKSRLRHHGYAWRAKRKALPSAQEA